MDGPMIINILDSDNKIAELWEASRKCPNFLDLGIYERPYMHKQNDVSRRKKIHNARTSFHAYVLGCESGQKENLDQQSVNTTIRSCYKVL